VILPDHFIESLRAPLAGGNLIFCRHRLVNKNTSESVCGN
jgi:hypothetical protein